jgi:hypothetical protein
VSVARPKPIPFRKHPRADYYVEGEEIISVKSYSGSAVSGQLAHVSSTWDVIEHLREFKLKYARGRLIPERTARRLKIKPTTKVGGRRRATLEGRYVLEVPPQRYPIPEEILREAERQGVTIRDVLGKVYTAQ